MEEHPSVIKFLLLTGTSATDIFKLNKSYPDLNPSISTVKRLAQILRLERKSIKNEKLPRRSVRATDGLKFDKGSWHGEIELNSKIAGYNRKNINH